MELATVQVTENFSGRWQNKESDTYCAVLPDAIGKLSCSRKK